MSTFVSQSDNLRLLKTRQLPMMTQYFLSIAFVVLVSALCFLTDNYLGYKTVALILLMVVSFIAMLFEIFPVLLAALLSALIWNFFFIPPIFTFHIDNAEDILMFLLYFLIALVHTVLTFKIREAETKARDKEEREKTIKLYNTLLNSLSHELRTPISTIIGAVDTLIEHNDKLTVTHQTELLNEIDKASIRLNRQVENLLSMSRLESGILKPKNDWCDINELICSQIDKLPNSTGHKIEFRIDEGLPLFKLDAGLLDQILHNIIHNCLQYTPEHSIITISAHHMEGNCIIRISDNGNGFPNDEVALVFEKFYRLTNTKTGGSGLGLSIVRGFTEAMNGKVLLENDPKGGAIFTIEIMAETSFIGNLKHE